MPEELSKGSDPNSGVKQRRLISCQLFPGAVKAQNMPYHKRRPNPQTLQQARRTGPFIRPHPRNKKAYTPLRPAPLSHPPAQPYYRQT